MIRLTANQFYLHLPMHKSGLQVLFSSLALLMARNAGLPSQSVMALVAIVISDWANTAYQPVRNLGDNQYSSNHSSSSLSLICPRQISEIPVHQPSAHLRLGHMDKITNHGVVQLIPIDHLAIQQSPFTPSDLPAPLLIHQ